MGRENLDMYLDTPYEMKQYLRRNGYHFSKKMYEFATSKMYKTNKEGKKEKEQEEKIGLLEQKMNGMEGTLTDIREMLSLALNKSKKNEL